LETGHEFGRIDDSMSIAHYGEKRKHLDTMEKFSFTGKPKTITSLKTSIQLYLIKYLKLSLRKRWLLTNALPHT
jgi:hypothetical protein